VHGGAARFLDQLASEAFLQGLVRGCRTGPEDHVGFLGHLQAAVTESQSLMTGLTLMSALDGARSEAAAIPASLGG